MKFKPELLATGIGSLPHTNCDQAYSLIRSTFEKIPHWPQLPRLDRSEDIIYQYTAALVRLGLLYLDESGRAYFDTEQPNWTDKTTAFYEIYLRVQKGETEFLNFFGFPVRSASGFHSFVRNFKSEGKGSARYIKGQVSGPLTTGFSLTDEKMVASFYNVELKDIVVKNLELHARWQSRVLASLGVQPIVFIDEPTMYAYGQAAFITLTREEIMEAINCVCDAIEAEGGIPGIHVCSPADLSIAMESNATVVDFDAYLNGSLLSVYATQLSKFLKRNGVLGWGIVPTSEKAWDEDCDSIVGLFQSRVKELTDVGINAKQLLEQSMITPSCGTGGLPIELAERVYDLTKEVSGKLRATFFADRSLDGEEPDEGCHV